MPTRESQNLRNRYMGALGQEAGTGQRFGEAYEDRAMGFDPYANIETAATGAWGSMLPGLQRQVEGVRGATARSGGGRLRSGYAEMDENDIWREGTNRLQNEIMRNTMQATQMDLQNTQGIGAYGQAAQGRYLDLLSGERDRETMEENRRRESRAGLYGGLGAVAGGVGGFFLGGPPGAAAGARAGHALGRGIGG